MAILLDMKDGIYNVGAKLKRRSFTKVQVSSTAALAGPYQAQERGLRWSTRLAALPQASCKIKAQFAAKAMIQFCVRLLTTEIA